MDKSNKLEDWTDDEIAKLKTFWEGKIGQKYKKRLTALKDDVLDVCIWAPEPERVTRFGGIACGYESVLQDIDMLIKSEKKKEEPAKK